jgi:hypothetical protein
MGHLQPLRREVAPSVAPSLLGQPGASLCYELSPANVADVRLSDELIAEAGLGEAEARRLFLDLPYSSAHLREALAEVGILVATEPSERRNAVRQHIERAFCSLKRVFGLGETLAVTLIGLGRRIAAKMTAYTLMASRSTGHWVVPRAGSRTCGHENLATLI